MIVDCNFSNEELLLLFAGKKVYGHKVVLSARCEVMQAMFCGQFAEGTNINDVRI